MILDFKFFLTQNFVYFMGPLNHIDLTEVKTQFQINYFHRLKKNI